MSVSAMAWAWQQDVSPTDKLILLAIADHSDSQGVCWPGLAGLAEKCHIQKRAVQYHIQRLTSAGFVTRQSRYREDGSQASNLYVLPIVAPPHAKDCTPPMQRIAPHESSVEPSVKKTTPLPPKGDDSFDLFWKSYPKKAAKLDAKKAWRKLPSPDLPATILASLERFKQSNDWLKEHGKFIPHAATWLNGRRWEDELPPETPRTLDRPTITPMQRYMQRLIREEQAEASAAVASSSKEGGAV